MEMTRQIERALAECVDDLETRIEQLEAHLVVERTKNDDFFPGSIVASLIKGDNPLKVWRTHRGLTLAQLSNATYAAGRRVDIAYISEIERGKKPGSAAALGTLANALGLDLDDLAPAPRQTPSNARQSRRARLRQAPNEGERGGDTG
jgi:transcriptional regulator with XRE-family HTH domain